MENEMSFWDHLDELRGVIFRSLIFVTVLMILFFIFMPEIFDNIILAPCRPDFILYEWLCKLNETLHGILPDFCGENFHVKLINIKLASQFMTHMTTSFSLGLLFSFPFVLYQLWGFISPALYPHEKKGVAFAFVFGNILFVLGVFVGYIVVFPLTLRFLIQYELSPLIENQLSLDSYMSNFLTMIFLMGIFFELPLLSMFLSKIGVLRRSFFNKYRRHAIVFTLIAAAFITPSGDPFTLMVVFLPLYLLWELSAVFVKKDS
ncbi:MAG: twin-arginine translocase subunit TatC [Bacteroidales bacterium]